LVLESNERYIFKLLEQLKVMGLWTQHTNMYLVGEVILCSMKIRVVLVKPYCNPVNGSVQCLVVILYDVRYRTPLLEYRLRE